MNSRRVVITGMGAITPLGLSMQATWDALLAGKSGLAEITRFDPAMLPTNMACEVKSFDPTAANVMDAKEVRRSDLYEQFAMAAAQQAMRHSGLKLTPELAMGTGVVIGTAVGGHSTLVGEHDVLNTKGLRRMNPFTIPMVMNNGAAGMVAIAYGAQGPSYAPVSACSTGNDAIGQAFNLIRWGQARAVIAGGSDATVALLGMAGFAQVNALSTRGSETPRPFDKARDGVVIGEGAAIFVLESLDLALDRGAHILAEIAGYAQTNDAFHIIAPSKGGVGAARAINLALTDAGMTPADVDYINAHGTATPLNDVEETHAIKLAFGDQAYKVAISSTKSAMGHCMGAAGAIEAAVCVMAIAHGVVPPTLNHTAPDPQCDLDYVPLTARTLPVRVAMNNSFGFGGHNSVVIFKRYDS